MPTPWNYLNRCAELEQSIGDLYRRFAGGLAGEPAVADLFRELAGEEDGHARALQLVARLLRSDKGETRVAPEGERMAQLLGDGLSRANALLDGGSRLTADDALVVAIRIESSALEAHGPDYIETPNDELRKTVRMLVSDTDRHRERLAAELARLREG